jgi:hypothetical protein
VPNAGVTKVGLLANTKAPVPVSFVTAAARLADEGVAKKVATPAPRPDTPVLMGRPVALVRVTADGVPKAGVTKVGEVARTLLPEPVLVTLTACLLALRAKAVEAVRPESVKPGIVAFVAESKYTARAEGCVQMTSFRPAPKLTSDPELLEESTVLRLNVLPKDV